MTERSLWFESHLFADRAGRQAHAAYERLDPSVQACILAAGDRLAEASPAVAQQFYRRAASVWQAVGASDFNRWMALGSSLLASDTSPRDAALAFFELPPKTIARAGMDALAAWCATGQAVSATSRTLGATFFTATAAVVGNIPAGAFAVWAEHGLRLRGGAGWRAEFVAQAYFAAAAHVLPTLQSDEIDAWSQLGVAVQSALKETQFFGPLPVGFAALTPPERRALLAAARVIAGANAAAGAAVYVHLPAALRHVRAASRRKVLEVFELAGAAVALSVADIVPVIGALVHDIPTPHRGAALDLAIAVARAFPAGSVALLRSLPMAYEAARHDGVCRWVTRGLEIAADSAEAGLAYFALESRTSVKVLQASSTAVTLNDVHSLLRKYVHMLSGRSAAIRGTDGFQLRSPLEEFPRENEITLPFTLDVFATHEDNARVYHFLAAQLAGRREFGTYDVTLPDAAGSLLQFLHAQEHGLLLEDLFLVAEGFRVAAALARGYPGIAREQRALTAQLLARLEAPEAPAHSRILDALFAALLAARPLDTLPAWLRDIAAVVIPCVAPLAAHDATANDALRIAQVLTAQLAAAGERGAAASFGDAYSDTMSGDALVAAYLYDDDDAPALPNDGPVIQNETRTPPPVLDNDLQLKITEDGEDLGGVTAPMSAEELQRLIEAGVDLRLKQGQATDLEGLGLYITDLLGKFPAEQLQELRHLLEDATRPDRPPPRRWLERRGEGTSFYYDEWDYHITDYRPRWCRLLESPLDGDSGEFFNRTLLDYAAMIPDVRRQFQRIRPEMYRTVRGLEDGDDFDLNAVVNARVDRRARQAPSAKLYVARQREERDVATLFLIDMSASTDEPMEKPAPPTPAGDDDASLRPSRAAAPRRIIDVTKEALVIMAQALDEIGDAYAIYGFSGHGRQNVEFYLVKAFNESLNVGVKGRIGGIEPKRSTRMGAALRHATEKMASISARSRHLILLSDGFPQDFDYGQDRRSNVYGLRDTTVALRECEAAGITPFCITVDKAGHDYLREMCDGSRYMVLDDIAALPRELPKIYQRVVGA